MPNKILVFDTETTALLKTVNDIDKFYILQLSWIVYDEITNSIVSENDFILKSPVPITNSHIHQITDKISAKGYEFSEIIDIFLEDVKNCDKILGYNLNFDLQGLEIELDRLGRFDDIDLLFEKKHCDPMKQYASFFNTKYLKLIDLYRKLFGEGFKAHNALQDVRATLRVYLTLNKK